MSRKSHVTEASTLLHLTRVGAGAPLLVVHGGLGWDHTYLRPGLDRLATLREVVYVDLRGNGRSRRPDTPDEWKGLDIATWAEDLELVRRELGVERVTIFAHSFGAAVAQTYALARPDHVRGLVLCGGYPAFDYFEAAMAGALARATPEQRTMLQAAVATRAPDDASFGALGAALLPLYFHRPDPALIAAAFGSMLVSAEAFNRSFHDCLPFFDVTGQLPGLRVPTLVVSGDDDWIAPLEHAAHRLVHLIPEAELAVVAGTGHFPFLERPDATAELLQEWLNRLEVAVPPSVGGRSVSNHE